MTRLKYTRTQRIAFYLRYTFYKACVLPFEVRTPLLKMYFFEMGYSLGKLLPPLTTLAYKINIGYVQSKYGKFFIRPHTIDMVCVSPSYERDDVTLLLEYIEKDLCDGSRVLFIDVGADFGTYSIAVANKFRNSKIDIVAYEPAPANHALLLRNLDENKLATAVQTYNFALGNKDNEELTLFFDPISPGCSGRGEHGISKIVPHSVASNRLDTSIISRVKNYQSIYIKIDVEGFETEVIEGASEIMNSGIPVFLMVEDFVDPRIIKKMHELDARFLTKRTPYNSWWAMNV